MHVIASRSDDMTLIDAYVCHCSAPRPLIKYGEESGICEVCSGIYDEYIYEMRCRQYEANWHFPTVHDYLMEADPIYREMAKTSPLR